ncbi:ferredoxin [Micromonospora sp. WMMD882]|uniref:ferredoxin n=1 Tax=Micromonospora sp. WMMD882 TaxID=3015151 RepID=UPI00248B736D|nr:ferredoxin [Micromonospora sp. WMMD882]WBB80574.1 ferredoxin [Micromonospora sp. WMMD882]
MRVTVDRTKCYGSGQCVATAPDVFDQRDEDGLVELLTATPSPDRHADVVDAAGLCPAAAITTHAD